MKRVSALALYRVLLRSSALAVEEGFTVRHGDRSVKRICITVDDCKDTAMLRQILRPGQELGVPITFFTLGYVLLDEDRDLWRRLGDQMARSATIATGTMPCRPIQLGTPEHAACHPGAAGRGAGLPLSHAGDAPPATWTIPIRRGLCAQRHSVPAGYSHAVLWM